METDTLVTGFAGFAAGVVSAAVWQRWQRARWWRQITSGDVYHRIDSSQIRPEPKR